MTKRIISVLLAAVMVFSLTACKDEKSDKTSTKTPTTSSSSESDNAIKEEAKNDLLEDSVTRDYFYDPDTVITSVDELSSSYEDTTPHFIQKSAYSNPQGYVNASQVVTKNGRTYIEHNGVPYVMHCIRIRTDRIIQKYHFLNKKQWDVYMREYFKQAKLLGFDCVSFEIQWAYLEPSQDNYDFNLYDCIYSYCEEFDLNVQLVWFGSNNCGFYIDVPRYIQDDLKTYPRYDYVDPSNGKVYKNAYMNYSNPKLYEREEKALLKLMEHLYQYDTDRRTVTIQILNEANAIGGSLPSSATIVNQYDRDEISKKVWVQGQKEEILNHMNKLGMAVKNGPYRMVTRYNFISYTCHHGKAADGKLVDDSVERVYNLEGIDIVGMDCFDTGMTMDTIFMSQTTAFEGNIPHIPESNAAIANAFAKQLNAFKLGGGLIFYEVRGTEGTDALSLFKLDDYEFIPRTGEDSVGGVMEASTTDWTSFNRMVKSAGYMLVTSNLNDFITFNIDEMKSNITETRMVGNLSVTFNTSTKASYGSVGYVLKATDGSYIFYSLKGTTTFSFDNATLNGNVEKGYYNDKGVWVKTGEVAKTGNGFLITENQASKGTVFRVVPSQLS